MKTVIKVIVKTVVQVVQWGHPWHGASALKFWVGKIVVASCVGVVEISINSFW